MSDQQKQSAGGGTSSSGNDKNREKNEDTHKKKEKNSTIIDDQTFVADGAIIVVAKCPMPGKSKTRLIPLLGDEGSVKLAKAMLSDILMTLDRCPELKNVQKILFYGPGNNEGRFLMQNILKELGLKEQECNTATPPPPESNKNNGWILLPMLSSSSLTSSNLSIQLSYALLCVRNMMIPPDSKPVVFLGMDAPELAIEEIITAIYYNRTDNDSTNNNAAASYATLCPAADGGYTMLCLPPSSSVASSTTKTNSTHDRNGDHRQIFDNVLWSHPLAALSQLKVLSDNNIPIRLGKMMYDIDEPEDVKGLCERLQTIKQQQQQPTSSNDSSSNRRKSISNNNSLLRNSSGCNNKMINSRPSHTQQTSLPDTYCHYTGKVLEELGVLVNKGEDKS